MVQSSLLQVQEEPQEARYCPPYKLHQSYDGTLQTFDQVLVHVH